MGAISVLSDICRSEITEPRYSKVFRRGHEEELAAKVIMGRLTGLVIKMGVDVEEFKTAEELDAV